MKKFAAAALAALLALALVGCTGESGKTTASAAPNSATPSVTQTEDAEITPTPKPAPPTVDPSLTYSFGYEEMAQPLWQSSTMYNECITFQENEEGNITAKLLFKPIQVISVRDNSLGIELKEGVHFKFDENDPQTLIWLEGDENFVIPYFKKGDLTSPHKDNCGTSGMNGIIGTAMYCVGEWLYSKQLAITYTYDPSENEIPHAEFAGSLLPKTLEKLKNGQTVKMSIYGDSIFTGCESSATYNREPNVPTFFDLLKNRLEALYPGCTIELSNHSVGGWQAKNGVENVQKVVDEKPDIVILGFGMNDARVGGVVEAQDITAMMDAISAGNPDCEYIVVSTFHANSTIGWDLMQKTHGTAFKKLEKTGVAAMDMYKLHSYLLARKYYQDTTGNNINHPNDWLARMYTMQLLTMLYDFNAAA